MQEQVIRIQQDLHKAATRSDMDTLCRIVSNLSSEEKQNLPMQTCDEVLLSAANYTEMDADAGTKAVITLMRAIGYRVSQDTLDFAMFVFPESGFAFRSF